MTNVGRALLAKKLLDNDPVDFKYVGWGTGAGTAAVTDTTLFTEASEERVIGVKSRVTVNVTNDTIRVVATLTANGAKTITNAGLFDAPTGGNMAIKTNFTGEVLALDGQIEFTFQATF